MINTAPIIIPVINSLQQIETQSFDFEKINLFNTRIELCSQCEKCIEGNKVPFCSEQNSPLAVAANQISCPIGKW